MRSCADLWYNVRHGYNDYMRQIIPYFVVFAALALSVGRMAHAALPERAAVVYSEWGKNIFANEYDKHLKQLGWAFDKYENVRLPELSGKLGGYNLVIATSVANYTKNEM